MDDYKSLSVYQSTGPAVERFEECKVFVSPHRVLIVAAGDEIHVWNAESWLKTEGKRDTTKVDV